MSGGSSLRRSRATVLGPKPIAASYLSIFGLSKLGGNKGNARHKCLFHMRMAPSIVCRGRKTK